MPIPNADLLGDVPGLVPTGTNPGALAAVDASLNKDEVSDTERQLVKKLCDEYKAARQFDEDARKQYTKDRAYASGKADPRWASDANLIGSFIDVLVSFLYAQNPDVSCRPAQKVVAPKPPAAAPMAPPMLPGAAPLGDMLAPPSPAVPPLPGVGLTPPVPVPPPGVAGPQAAPSQDQMDATAFAETAELVVSSLWKNARLKKAARKMVRSSLSVGPGWFKALMFSEKQKDPQVEKSIRDMQDSLKQIQAAQQQLAEGADGSDLTTQAELELKIQGAQKNLMKLVRQGMTIDFTRAEDHQVSLDVADTEDYLDADWNSDDLYVPKTSLRTRFPSFTDEDVKRATTYYQRKPTDGATLDDMAAAAADGQFTKSAPGSLMGGNKPIEFAKIVELWDKRDGLVKTFVEGIEKWAVQPYPPPQATSRFYPHFRIAFFETDGSRHPQSLSWRLRKLQDEYSAARSNGRLTRERSIPKTIFNKGQIAPEDARAIANGTHMEMVGVMPTNPDLPLEKLVAAVAQPNVDFRVFDTTPITADMERISGVQEALQSSVQVAKTAREASIQQSGFAARTNADRGILEDMLTDLAQYTLECAVQEIQPEFAQRIAGPAAFWPYGMDVQDLLTLVEIEIQGGTTGKPDAEAAKQSWSIILPMLKELILQIRGFEATDPALADALVNLLRETVRRLDDRLDVDMFIPAGPAPPPLIPPLPGAGPPATAGGSPPGGTPPKPDNLTPTPPPV